MAYGRCGLLLVLSLSSGCVFLSGCGGDEDGGGNSTATGGAAASGGGPSGGSGSGGATSQAGGSPPHGDTSGAFSLVESGGAYTLEHGNVVMVVTPNQGGRILSFTVAGSETLVQEGEAPEHGSTFWPSPQNWGWPPATDIAEIDPNPYAAVMEPQRLILTSDNNPFLGAVVTKTFGPAASRAGVLGFAVTYTIQNTSASEITCAGWEISRAKRGVVFYPEGQGGLLETSTLIPQSALGHAWYTYDAVGLEEVPKIYADGGGGWLAWAAHGLEGDGTLVVKSFADVLPGSFAMGEAEIEIYADPSGDYMEVEQQGPLTMLQAGQILSWRVEWYGAPVPASLAVQNGSHALLDLVQTTLGAP